FLPLAAALFDARRSRPMAGPAFAAALVTLYGAATWQHAALWGDEDRLLLVWAAANPESARAQVSAAQVWLKNGRPDQALAVLADASEQVPGSVLWAANTLAFRAELGVLSLAELEGAADLIRNGRFDAQAIRGLEHLVTILNARGPLPDHARVVNDL